MVLARELVLDLLEDALLLVLWSLPRNSCRCFACWRGSRCCGVCALTLIFVFPTAKCLLYLLSQPLLLPSSSLPIILLRLHILYYIIS